MIDRQPLHEAGPVRLKRCRHGLMLYLVGDEYVGRSLDLYGEFSEGETRLFAQIVRPGWTVLDIGANVGAHTLFLARAVGPQGAVLAFEPQRVLFQILCANVALNGLGNVFAHPAAVGAAASTIVVPRLDYAKPANFGGLALGAHDQGERVGQITIDSLCLERCHLIKLDIEGMETEAIAGAANTIRAHHPVLYVENDRKERSAGLIRCLLDLGYSLYWHLPPLFSPDNHFGEKEDRFGRIVSVNMLCVHQTARQDIRGLRRITSPDDDWRAPAC